MGEPLLLHMWGGVDLGCALGCNISCGVSNESLGLICGRDVSIGHWYLFKVCCSDWLCGSML